MPTIGTGTVYKVFLGRLIISPVRIVRIKIVLKFLDWLVFLTN